MISRVVGPALFSIILSTNSLAASEGPTALDRVVAFYNQSVMPALSDFDPNSMIIGKTIRAEEPNEVLESIFVAVEKGDVVIGPQRVVGLLFSPKKTPTLEEAQNCVKNGCEGFRSPSNALQKDNTNKAFSESFSGGDFNCAYESFWRTATVEGGKKILVAQDILSDKRTVCNPTTRGVSYGQVRSVSYYELP